MQRRETEKFERPDIFRPPSERESYFLPLTGGCSNNTCTFCGMYKGKSFCVRPVDEVLAEIARVPATHRPFRAAEFSRKSANSLCICAPGSTPPGMSRCPITAKTATDRRSRGLTSAGGLIMLSGAEHQIQ